jgi:hypothetical protein
MFYVHLPITMVLLRVQEAASILLLQRSPKPEVEVPLVEVRDVRFFFFEFSTSLVDWGVKD